MCRRKLHSAGPEYETAPLATAKSPAAAVPKNASICVAAAALAVDGADAPGRRVAGDAPAPGIGRLARRRPSRDPAARCLPRCPSSRRDRGPLRGRGPSGAWISRIDAGVRRGAAIGRGPARLRDDAARSPASVPRPTTSAPCVTLTALSTRGAIVQWPARRSSPNQLTTSDTRLRFGHSACSASSDATTSAAAVS